ncbi:MAG: lytic transglycosylase domain-containing protein [Candidatus Aenigmatarchaeota archaeon]
MIPIISVCKLVFMLSFFILSSPSYADIYSYVDEDGVIHFSNVPTDPRYKLKYRERTHFRYKITTYEPYISEISNLYGVDEDLIRAVIKVESNFNPSAISRKGAVGLMQLMPTTADGLNVKDPFNPRENLEGGVKYLRFLLDQFGGNIEFALAAYNAGPETVMRYGGIPPYPETRQYIRKVMEIFRKIKSQK